MRVFWSWYNAGEDEDPTSVEWEAPSNARWHFGNTRALYKMYFTSEMRDQAETAEESPCRRFAQEFLPVVSQALAVVHGDVAPSTTTTEVREPAAATDDETTDDEVANAPDSESLDDEPVGDAAIDSLFGNPAPTQE